MLPDGRGLTLFHDAFRGFMWSFSHSTVPGQGWPQFADALLVDSLGTAPTFIIVP